MLASETWYTGLNIRRLLNEVVRIQKLRLLLLVAISAYLSLAVYS